MSRFEYFEFRGALTTNRRMTRLAALTALVVSFGLLYQQVVLSLVSDWWTDDNYSHGFLIVPVALYLAWDRRERLGKALRKPSALGLVLIVGSLVVMAVGVLGVERFLPRISMLGVLTGTILFLYGWRHLRILAFPLAFLLLMIPIPAIVFLQITFPLQLLASQFGETTLSLLDVPVLREGNIIVLAHTTLEVAEACSGIRSLVSLLTLGIIYGYFSDPRIGVRATFALATVPFAIVANGLRVAGTGVLAHYYGAEVATGFFHTFSGWVVFVVSFGLLMSLHPVVQWIAGASDSSGTEAPA